jgi:hypothetical protein
MARKDHGVHGTKFVSIELVGKLDKSGSGKYSFKHSNTNQSGMTVRLLKILGGGV